MSVPGIMRSSLSTLKRARASPAFLIVRSFASSAKAAKGKMSAQEAFGDASFDVERYLFNRPRYPDHLYSWIKSYHNAQDTNGTLLDLGCGPGFAAFPLLASFQGGLIGIDTSKGMVKSAPEALHAWLKGSTTPKPQTIIESKARFAVATSSDLSGIVDDRSIDLAIAATAAHWFDYPSTWKELSRVIKPGGSVIWWTYGEHYMPSHPDLQDRIFAFMQKDGPGSIGPYFPQPGRSYLANLLNPLPFPQDLRSRELPQELCDQWDLSSATRKTHPLVSDGRADLSWLTKAAAASSADMPDLSSPFRLEQTWTWKQYESYIRTSSALHAYLKSHPEEKEGQGDVANRFVRDMKSLVLQRRREITASRPPEQLDDENVRIAWPLGLMAIKKKL